MPSISFVIPCYRSEKTIEKVIEEIRDVMSTKQDYSYDVVLVNDSSPDNTWNVINGLCNNYSNIIGVNLAKNFGQHAALMAGFVHVSGEYVVCLDDDGQTPPNQVFKLIDKLEEGYDVVYAKYPEKKHSLFRNIGSNVNKKMTEALLDKPKDLYQSSYFAARRFVIEEMRQYSNPYPYAMGLVLRTTRNITNVMVEHHEREEGTTGYTIKKLISLLVNGFTAFSVKPLRIATIMGLVTSFLGVIYTIYAIIVHYTNPLSPMGWTSLVIIVLIIGGMILFVLGLIGEYIGRIYISINNSPQYVIKEVIKLDDNSDKR